MLGVTHLCGFGASQPTAQLIASTSNETRFTTLPSEIEANDLIVGIAWATRPDASMTATAPTGFTQIGQTQVQHSGGSNRRTKVTYFYKKADGSEAGASVDTYGAAPDAYKNIYFVFRYVAIGTPAPGGATDTSSNGDPGAITVTITGVGLKFPLLVIGYQGSQNTGAVNGISISPDATGSLSPEDSLYGYYWIFSADPGADVSIDQTDGGDDANQQGACYIELY